MKLLTVLMLSAMMISNFAYGRSHRINQIPNGTTNRCINCHQSALGGDARNPFGIEVQNNFLNNGDVVWNSELASIDSDGDGFTNGEELQDPEGAWSPGNPAPGNPNLVTNPGDPTSFPNTTRAEYFSLKSGFLFNSVSPNPTKGNSNLSFSTKNNGNMEIELYDTKGKSVKKLYTGYIQSGSHTISLNVDGNINSGNYFLNIRFNGFSWIEKLNVVR